MAIINDILFQSLNTVRNQTMVSIQFWYTDLYFPQNIVFFNVSREHISDCFLQILKQRVDEKMAILQIDTNKDSWGHALLRIKNFLNEEIGAIYLEVFGINGE